MANPAVQGIVDQAAQNVDAEKSAVIVLNGIKGMIDDAVAKATANGATAEELVPVSDVSALLKSSAADLSAAVVANTPAAPTAKKSK